MSKREVLRGRLETLDTYMGLDDQGISVYCDKMKLGHSVDDPKSEHGFVSWNLSK